MRRVIPPAVLLLLFARPALADFEAIPLAVGQVILQPYAVGVALALLSTVYRFGWALVVGTIATVLASACSLIGLAELALRPSLLRNGDIRGILPTTLALLAFVWLAPMAEYLAFRWLRSR